MKWLDSVFDAIVDRTPEELIGAIGVAVVLSLAIAGLFALLRKKTGDRVLLVIVLLILANVASMALGAGYIVSLVKAERTLGIADRRPSDGRWIRSPRPSFRIDPQSPRRDVSEDRRFSLYPPDVIGPP